MNVAIDFHHKDNILFDSIGDGKTLLIHAIKDHYLLEGKSVAYIDYAAANNTPEQTIISCKGRDIVLLDNVDLYLTNEILEEIRKTSGIIIISIRDISKLDLHEAAIYDVEYTSTELKATQR